jgi:two-component system cell cycle sensor histidine kinase/response regulator CckA
MSGPALARSLEAFFPGLRRLFVSGYTATVVAGQGVLEPGTHFLQKPFSERELAASVRAAIDADAPASEPFSARDPEVS